MAVTKLWAVKTNLGKVIDYANNPNKTRNPKYTEEQYQACLLYTSAPPIDYDNVMNKIPYGKVITIGKIREYFAKLNGADFTEPITAGIFVSIAAVSYTHLDVYKRQAWVCASTRSARRRTATRFMTPAPPAAAWARPARSGMLPWRLTRHSPRCWTCLLYTSRCV